MPAAASLIVLAGCEGAGASGCSDPSPAPAGEMTLLPNGLSFDKIGPITHVVETAGNVTAQAVSNKPLDELTVLIQDAVTAAGYRPGGMDNEGDEAEVFFNSGAYAAGQAIIRRADCEGRWNIDLVLIDPSTLGPSSTARAPG